MQQAQSSEIQNSRAASQIAILTEHLGVHILEEDPLLVGVNPNPNPNPYDYAL
jgi:hypothetical protein